jgi:predicted metal-binding membrane protein
MNLAWVAFIALVVFAQKLLPRGRLVSRLGGAALLLCGAGLILRGIAYAA